MSDEKSVVKKFRSEETRKSDETEKTGVGTETDGTRETVVGTELAIVLRDEKVCTELDGPTKRQRRAPRVDQSSDSSEDLPKESRKTKKSSAPTRKTAVRKRKGEVSRRGDSDEEPMSESDLKDLPKSRGSGAKKFRKTPEKRKVDAKKETSKQDSRILKLRKLVTDLSLG